MSTHRERRDASNFDGVVFGSGVNDVDKWRFGGAGEWGCCCSNTLLMACQGQEVFFSCLYLSTHSRFHYEFSVCICLLPSILTRKYSISALKMHLLSAMVLLHD